MEWTTTIITMLCAIAIVGIICFSFQIYQIIKIDAKARGLKHPNFLGIFAMSSNNGGGLILYLIGRRKYPIINMSQNDKVEITKRKKILGVALIFLSVSMIGIVICIAKFI